MPRPWPGQPLPFESASALPLLAGLEGEAGETPAASATPTSKTDSARGAREDAKITSPASRRMACRTASLQSRAENFNSRKLNHTRKG